MILNETHYKNCLKNIQYKLVLTNEAQIRVKELMLKNVCMIGLRISIKKSGCAGFSYVFKEVIKKNYNNTDIIFTYENGAKIFISPKIFPFIHGSKLDYIENGLNHIFQFTNPNVNHFCGCGMSFNL